MISAKPSNTNRPLRRNAFAALATALVTLFASTANAEIIFPNVPLQVSPNVPANILFILDDSGSMEEHRMSDTMPHLPMPPGQAEGNDLVWRSSWLNALYYDPRKTYRPWVRADGSLYPQADFGNAAHHPAFWNQTMGPIGATQYRTDYIGNNIYPRDALFFFLPESVAPMNVVGFERYRIASGGIEKCTWGTNRFNVCTTLSTVSWPGGITRTAPEERQNFANWFQYHRTRMKAAKSGAGAAFGGIDSGNLRVGYTRINRTNYIPQMPIPTAPDGGVFTGASRTNWYNNLYAQDATGNTPLRPALDRAGRYFKYQTGNSGPWGPLVKGEQLSCRQSFAILTTDGYHNNNSGNETHTNVDGVAGPLITSDHPEGGTYQYVPELPYRDNVPGTLADVAMRYWSSDLRPDLPNRVPYTAGNPAFWQHMVTFGMSLGATGNLVPGANVSQIIDGTRTWPTTNPSGAATIDDFWHATINGRGSFVVATDPEEFERGLRNALNQITDQVRSNSNVAVTSNRLQADSLAFEATFNSSDWSGDVKAYSVTATGVDTSAHVWSAGEQLATIPFASRKIFRWNTEEEQGETFSWSNLSTAERDAFGGDEERFDYVRGDGSRELGQPSGVFRARNRNGRHWLIGDISGSSPVYDAENRVVYVGANDGMLHAFDATNGKELFAYVPGGIDYAELASLADPEYSHKFFVDGQLTLAKVKNSAGVERTMLYGVLGRGGNPGRSPVFALDVTDPTSFTVADIEWEVTDSDVLDAAVNVLEAPLVAKLNNGRTGVLLANGYNSNAHRAALIVLDAAEGDTGTTSGFDPVVIYRSGGSLADPNGLGAISAWDEGNDGVVDYVYAGDLHGRVWRFDLENDDPLAWPGAAHRQLFQAVDDAGNRQPITGRISVGVNPTTYQKWIYFGTGRFLEAGDRHDLRVQSWYGMREWTGTPPMPTRADLAERTFELRTTVSGREFRTIPPATVTAGMVGWRLDLVNPPDGTPEGERITGSTLFMGSVLLVASNSPNNDPCEPGMMGWVNAIDPFTGGGLTKPFMDVDGDGDVDENDRIDGDAASSISLNNGFTTDPTFVGTQLVAGGKVSSVTTLPSEYLGRISWRELIRNDE